MIRTWRPPTTTKDFRPALTALIEKWKGTPYRRGQQCPGVGVDCVGFVCGMLDGLTGRSPTQFDRFPSDTAFHTREGAIAAIYAIRDRFRPNSTILDEFMEPGDVVLVGPGGAGSHAMLVGNGPHEFWHASMAGVVKAGSNYFGENKIHGVIRADEREGWARG
jgi:cell wall-associated NlpC family hydrolase